MIDLGVVHPGSIIRVPFATFGKTNGESITMTNFAAADVLIYKDGSTTERASTAGYTATTDFDTKTGRHLLVIDLADNTTADFYAAGSEYLVAIDSVTVDSQTVGTWVARFKIGYDAAVSNTTIATLASQTSFTLTAGPANDSALVGCIAVVHAAASAVQKCIGVVSAYTGSTKTVTLAADPAIFTMAAKDNISFFVPSNTRFVGGTVQTARDIGLALPAVAAGAANGLMILGTNNTAAITIGALTVGAISGTTLTLSGAVAFQSTFAVTGTTTLTGAVTLSSNLIITGTTTLTGNVVLSDGLTVSAPSTTNRAGITITGNGTGAAINATAGATGNGLVIAAGAGHGMTIAGAGSGKIGLQITSTSSSAFYARGSLHGMLLESNGTGNGLKMTSGSSAAGFYAENTSTGHAMQAIATGGGNGFDLATSNVIGINSTVTGNITGNLSGSVGSVTGLTAANLDVAVSSRLASASYTAPDNSSVTAIKAKTDLLPSDPADASDIAALLTTITAYVDTLETQLALVKAKTDLVGTTSMLVADAITAASVSAAAANKLADHIRRRTQANVEASTDGDTLNKSSLYGMVQQVQESNTTDNAGSLTIYKTDGTTELGRITVDTDAAAEPITGVS